MFDEFFTDLRRDFDAMREDIAELKSHLNGNNGSEPRLFDTKAMAIDSSVRQASVARMCRCVALARIERDELYRQAVDPETGKHYESVTEYFANPDVVGRFGIPDDRRRRSILMIQGRALLDAHTSGAIGLECLRSDWTLGETQELVESDQAVRAQVVGKLSPL